MTLREIGNWFIDTALEFRAFIEEVVVLASFQESWLDAPLTAVFWALVLYFFIAKAFYEYVWLSIRYLTRYLSDREFRESEQLKGDDAPLRTLKNELKDVGVSFAKLLAGCAVVVLLSYVFL
jgi:hypothetical protein